MIIVVLYYPFLFSIKQHYYKQAPPMLMFQYNINKLLMAKMSIYDTKIKAILTDNFSKCDRSKMSHVNAT